MVIVMFTWSTSLFVYYANLSDISYVIIILGCIPGIDVLTLPYWIAQLFLHFWEVVYILLNLLWMISSTTLAVFIGIGYYWVCEDKFTTNNVTLTNNYNSQTHPKNDDCFDKINQDDLQKYAILKTLEKLSSVGYNNT